MRPTPARILLACDDTQLRSLLSELLATQHYDVVAVGTYATPWMRRPAADWDAAIIDSALPHGAARWVRALEGITRVPTIAIAAKAGAGMGPVWNSVDAVLHEPFDARKLMLVMRGLLAGRTRARAEKTLTAGPMTLHSPLNTATVDAREIALTDAETRVLRELMLAASTPVPRDRLMRTGIGRDSSPADRSLDTHIKRLRRKIGTDRHGKTPVRTVRGVGYLLIADWQPAP
jgi:DNA-binding response OmpR family regulator